MIVLLIFFTGLSILFYCLFAGADFGAGILSLAAGQRLRSVLDRAIAPIWEANHIWLVLLVVILFMGFPQVYSVMCTYLHIPLGLLLFGIILRGTSFTFLHYDVEEDRSHLYYSRVFRISSLVTPFFLGVVAGASVLGRIRVYGEGFVEQYVSPWFNAFSFSTGIFTMALFAFAAAAFLPGEEGAEEDSNLVRKIARHMQLTLIACGGAVFAAAWWDGYAILSRFVTHPLSLASVAVATIAALFFWNQAAKPHPWMLRWVGGIQIAAILLGWFAIQYPVMLNLADAESLTFANAAAPAATQWQLLFALLVGSVFILPALGYLFYVFKAKTAKAH